MKILITGADGQLGKEIQNLFVKDGIEIIPYGKKQLDITNRKEVNAVLNQHQPNVIINAAAFTKVDLCEVEIEKAYLVNAIGPFNLAVEAKKMDCRLFHISTDYVFNGEKNTPYEVDDFTSPNTIYGKSKKLGEELVLAINEDSTIIRTSWLYGHKADNFVNTMVNLSNKLDEIKVVDDQIGCPTYTKDLVLILQSLLNEKPGIYHVTNLGKCSWYEFACEILQFLNRKTKIIQVTTKEYGAKTPRPMYSVLSNKKLVDLQIHQRDWKEALHEFLRKEYGN